MPATVPATLPANMPVTAATEEQPLKMPARYLWQDEGSGVLEDGAKERLIGPLQGPDDDYALCFPARPVRTESEREGA